LFFNVLEDNSDSKELLKYEELIRKWCVLVDRKSVPKNDEDLPKKL